VENTKQRTRRELGGQEGKEENYFLGVGILRYRGGGEPANDLLLYKKRTAPSSHEETLKGTNFIQ